MNALAAATALYGYLVPPVMVLLSATLAIRSAYQDIRRGIREHRKTTARAAAT